MSDILFLISGILALLAGLFFCIRPILPNVLFIYGSMWLFDLSNFLYIPKSTLTFWGIATLMLLGIDFLSPKSKSNTFVGTLYIFIGSLVGMLVAVEIDFTFNIIGTFIGAILGTLAFARTPRGRAMLFHTSTIIQYFCACGLRIVVATSMIGVMIIHLLPK